MLKLAKVSAPKTARGVLAFRIDALTCGVSSLLLETIHGWMQAPTALALRRQRLHAAAI